MDITKEYNDLKQVIEDAGKHARAYFESDVNPATQKEDGSLVTEIDQRVERIIREHVEARFPDDTIVGEEEDTKEGTSGFVWYIDPIDGTDNFVRKIPFFSVTATRLGPTPEDSFSIIHNPVSRQTFASLMEDGTYENEHVCNLTADPIGSKYFITTASMKSEPWMNTARYKLLQGLVAEYGKSGHFSSGLLEHAYVAAGRLDGFLGTGYTAWDTAAGFYLVKAAGGAISLLEDGKWQRYEGAIRDIYGPTYDKRVSFFISHPDIHEKVLEFVGNPKDWAEK